MWWLVTSHGLGEVPIYARVFSSIYGELQAATLLRARTKRAVLLDILGSGVFTSILPPPMYWCKILLVMVKYITFHTLSYAEVYDNHYFPACADIVDVYPYPYSVLKSQSETQDVYAVQVTFSKPFKYQRYHQFSIFLSPWRSYELAYYRRFGLRRGLHAYDFYPRWQGNERSMLFLFKDIDPKQKSQ